MGDWWANNNSWKQGNSWDSKDASKNSWDSKDAGNKWDSKDAGNKWDKKDAWASNSWDKRDGGNDWDKKKEENAWEKKDENAWEKKDDSRAEETNNWDADRNWTAPEDPKLACLGMKKDWTKETWEAAEKRKEADISNFHQYQQDNSTNQITSQKNGWQLDEEEREIFGANAASAGIDFEKYETIPAEITGNKADVIPVAKTFEELFTQFTDLPPAVMDNIRRCNYKTPTPVQKYAIPVALAGRDVMCCAQTGSGKTASFLIPIVGRMMQMHHNPIGSMTVPFEGQCDPDTLILSPTRELCLQIYEEACKFTHRTPYRVVRIYGGERCDDQVREICKGTDVLVATPGRLIDFIATKSLIRLDRVHHLVLDEADRMLDMGFEGQVRQLVTEYGMPDKDRRQTMMFSATFAAAVQTLAKDFLHDHIWVGIGRVGGAVETVTQELVEVTAEEKPDKLLELIDHFLDHREEAEVGIIFCNSKTAVKFLDEHLWNKKVDSVALHGELKQYERDAAMRKIRQSEVDVMIATDLASRGLDIDKVRLVINYDLPSEVDAYIHRIGRTGRIGHRGKAISFVTRASDGTPIENLTVLKELVNILNYTENTVPAWLQPLIDRSENPDKGYGWGGRDARNGDFGKYEERTKPWKAEEATTDANGSNDWWSTSKADPWKKDEAPAETPAETPTETPAETAETPVVTPETQATSGWNATTDWGSWPKEKETWNQNGVEQKGAEAAPAPTQLPEEPAADTWGGNWGSSNWTSDWN